VLAHRHVDLEHFPHVGRPARAALAPAVPRKQAAQARLEVVLGGVVTEA
jgi:hypothetical protein